jgi:hypothetical protein
MKDKKLQIGLPKRLNVTPGLRSDGGHPTYTAEELSETVAKAGVGYSRGGAHKYWRRVRAMQGGKLGWKYFYNNEKDRQEWADRQKKKIKRKTKHVEKLKSKAENHAPEDAHLRSEFMSHHPELAKARKALKDLTTEFVAEITGWEKAPNIIVTPAAMESYVTDIERAYEAMDGGEPVDLYNKQMHVMRTLEVAMKALPPAIKEHFSGSISSIEIGYGSEDPHTKSSPKTAGYCQGTTPSRIFLAWDRINPLGDTPWGQRPGDKKKLLGLDTRQYGQGSLALEVVLHEMAHALHNKLGAHRPPDGHMEDDYDGPNWADWQSFRHDNMMGKGTKKGGKNKEAGITTYAHKNDFEAFAESFAAAITHPKHMAFACPRAYEWMRKFMDPEGISMHPSGPTDEARVAGLKAKLETETDLDVRKKLQQQIKKSVGLYEMDYEDDRINIFKQKGGTPIQQMLESVDRPPITDQSTYINDPPSDFTTGKTSRKNHDRFFEMNYRGRTVYVRYGKPTIDDRKGVADFDPADPKKSGLSEGSAIRIDCIKEVFDENRKPIPREAIYWHLMQDKFEDLDKPIGTVKVDGAQMDVTPQHLLDHGYKGDKRGTKIERAIHALTDKLSAKFLFRNTTSVGSRVVQEALAKGVNAIKAGKTWKITSDKLTPERRSELEAVVFEDPNGNPPQPAAMAPHEIDCNDFRQRSGTFTYDRWDDGGEALVTKLRSHKPGTKQYDETVRALVKAQPGIKTVMTRDAKGRFKKRVIVMKADPQNPGFQTPVFDSKRFRCTNPDGTETVIDAVSDTSGVGYRIKDPMWSKLLTPNGEKVLGASDLARFSRQAAIEERATWISVKTDRKRVQTKGGRWKMEGRGDERSVVHAQVQFSGNGQPTLVGSKWSKELGKETARIDDLFSHDPIFSKLNDNARPVLERDQIHLDPPPPPPEGLPEQGQRILLRVDPEIGAHREKTIVAVVERVIKGSKAGEVPDPPGWDRMPEGVPLLEPVFPNPVGAKKLLKLEKELKEQGFLPEWYNGAEPYRKWFKEHYQAAYREWRSSKEEQTAKEYPTTYIFAGEAGMGAGGRVFTLPESKVMERLDHLVSGKIPRQLETDALVYQHEDIHPISGAVMARSIRVKPPKDESVSKGSLLAIPGSFEIAHPDGTSSVQIRPDQFEQARRLMGGMVMTDGVDRYLKERIDNLSEASKLLERESHVMPIEEFDPEWLADNWGAALNRTLPNGSKFELGAHQQQLLQKLIDNDGRVLGAHYMGTGKTVSALVAATMMMKRPLQKKLSVEQKVAMSPEDIHEFYAKNPPDPSRLDPDNPKRVLIVAPLNTVEQWRQAASDFDGGCRVIGGRSIDTPIRDFEGKDGQKIQDGEIVVVGPEYFTQHADKLKKLGFDGLIIDEVHMGIKNEKAERNKKVQEWNKDMNMMMLLTGTPMTTSPTDFIEYVRLLSKGTIWSDMTAKKFIDEYLEETPVPGILGEGGKGAKLQVKAEKKAELAAILGQWMDVALPKHVRGKTLPATRLEENKHAYMSGIQEQLYNLYMASLGDDGSDAGLDNEEIGRMADPESRRLTMAAKAVANCIGYKAGSPEKYIRFTQEAAGKEERKDFHTFNPDWLISENARGKAAGKFPSIDEIGHESALIYSVYMTDVLGLPYEELAGKPIGTGMPGTPKKNGLPSDAMKAAAIKRMRDADWDISPQGAKIPNPDAGELGIRFRGHGTDWKAEMMEEIKLAKGSKKQSLLAEYEERIEYIDRSLMLQRAYRMALATETDKSASPDDVLALVAGQFGVDFGDAMSMLNTHPNPTAVSQSHTVLHGGIEVHVTTDDNWVSDTKGSLHRLYHPDQWDEDTHEPISMGGFEKVKDGGLVNLSSKGLKQADLAAPKPKRGDYPTKADFEEAQSEAANWLPPKLRYDVAIVAPEGQAGLRDMSTGEIHIVSQEFISAEAISLLDPGMREERMKCDVAMTHQNAKCNELEDHITRFHGQGRMDDGPDGSRQMVLFGNGILDSCRTMEAKLRQMGFMDVNEAIEGSPHHDPKDPSVQGDPKGSAMGKYFVTYIGSTYTGNRDLNSDIFRKVKDRLDRDTDVSLFVNKIEEPRPTSKWNPPLDWKKPSGYEHTKGQRIERNWMMYPGDIQGSDDIQLSQWSKEQREQIKAAFGINAPESFVHVENASGVSERHFFYGTKKSEKILATIAKVGDPTKMMLEAKDEHGRGTGKFSPTEASRRAISQLSALREAYHQEAVAQATTDRPLTGHQRSVFNNCEFMVASDAAQVGLNWGNAVEQVQYDTLASPMAEDQRITRSARMLSPAVAKELIGTPVMIKKTNYKNEVVYERDDQNEVVKDSDGKKIPVMVQKYDERQRPVYQGDGPFSKLRAMEHDLFQARDRSRPVGQVAGLTINTEKGKDNVVLPKNTNFERAVGDIAHHSFEQAEELRTEAAFNTGAAKRHLMTQANEWESIANKCQTACTLGPTHQERLLHELSATTRPGSVQDTIISTKGISPITAQTEEGTYQAMDADAGDIVTLGVVQKIRDALNGEPVTTSAGTTLMLDESDRATIAKAGYIEAKEGRQYTTQEASSIYMAIRSHEILTWIEDNRDRVEDELRSNSAGAIVTASDVANTLIDSLPAQDRAILKSKKYLVNVRKIGAAGQVGKVVNYTQKPNPDEEGGTGKPETHRVFTGYEQEHPISTERRTRVMGRARKLSFESIIQAVEDKVSFIPDGDFQQLSANDLSRATVAAVTKSLIKLFFGTDILTRSEVPHA